VLQTALHETVTGFGVAVGLGFGVLVGVEVGVGVAEILPTELL